MLSAKYCLQNFYRLSLTLIFTTAFALPALAQTGIPVDSMSQCDTQMQTFLNNHQMPGATLAIAKNGKLIYMRGFGTASVAGTEAMQPYHMLRIASISKPITSIAIMKLIENGQLSLSDKVFGPNGILNADPYFASANITDTRVYNITIQNLLEHSAGWNRDLPMPQNPLPPYPWGFGTSDPISFPLHVTQTLGEANPVSRRAMIKFSIQRGLNFAPGTVMNYSNIGYLVLGEVIEKKSGMTYENYVKQTILAPLGIYDVRLGKTLLAEKQEREGEYFGPTSFMPSAFGTGEMVPYEYGGLSIEAMDAHGGWIASARDLVRFLTAVDGFPTRPDIISASTIQTMTTPFLNNYNFGYAKGWSVNPAGTWSHGGSLPGTYGEMVRTSGQYTWAVLLNKRTNSTAFSNAVYNLGWNCVNSTTNFPTHDFFDVPTQNASAMNFSSVTGNSMIVNWTNGNGDGRVLVMRANAAPNKFPLDGTDYAAQTDLGDGNRVVYSGTGNSATVSNLNNNTNYQFRLYEYKKNANTGNYALYQLGNPANGSQNTFATTAQPTRPFDFDGDGKSDVSVFRASSGTWYLQQSTNGLTGMQFGAPMDQIAPADFDGDGKTDVAVFRNGIWYLQRSSLGFTGVSFGESTDVPMPADYDGDGKADIAVFRPSTGVWYLNRSQLGFTGIQFGQQGDVPAPADYDADGKADVAVFRSGVWYLNRSQLGFTGISFGEANDTPVAADYDGDAKADVAVFRPSNGVWYLNRSQLGFTGIQFGTGGDFPVPADYDGDGKADVAVFRNGTWYLNRSQAGFTGISFGAGADKPVPNAFIRQ